MGKLLSDQIINHPAIHKTSNFYKNFDRISSLVSTWNLAACPTEFFVVVLLGPERERAVEVISCQFVF